MKPTVKNIPSNPNTDWLDEELRKEKALVVELRDTIDKQQVMLADQAQRLITLEDRLTKLQAQLLRIPEVEEALRRTRDELALMVAEQRQEAQKREAEFLRNRQAERERDVRAIQQIEMELARFDPLEQGLAVRQAEERRIGEGVLRLQVALDEINKRIGQGDDGRRQLAERIERNAVLAGQTQLAVQDVAKALQELPPRILLTETAIGKMGQQIVDLQTMRQEITKQQDELLENQRRSERQRAQVMTEWGRKLESYAHQIEVWADRLRYFTDQHDKNRKVLREVQEVAQNVSQQQDQLRQAQRIAEEQIRHELREWRAENERRWAQDADRREKAAEAQGERDSGQDARIVALEEAQPKHMAATAALDKRINDLQVAVKAGLERLRVAYLRIVRLQARAAQEHNAELEGLLGEGEQ